ncbi:MAG: hypothetical protein J6M60_02130 [Clostridia bacterium]|nr:hypothetical protein [Clostridia bacterium]
MDYLKEYDITDSQIHNLKVRYNSGIIEFLEKNAEFVEEKFNYLQKEKIVLLYEVMYNNIKIFLEEISELKRKIGKMKEQEISLKAMNMILIEEDLYDLI